MELVSELSFRFVATPLLLNNDVVLIIVSYFSELIVMNSSSSDLAQCFVSDGEGIAAHVMISGISTSARRIDERLL